MALDNLGDDATIGDNLLDITQMAEKINDYDDSNKQWKWISWQYDLKTWRERSCSHLYTNVEELVLTQFSMHKGLNVFGESGT